MLSSSRVRGEGGAAPAPHYGNSAIRKDDRGITSPDAGLGLHIAPPFRVEIATLPTAGARLDTFASFLTQKLTPRRGFSLMVDVPLLASRESVEVPCR